MYRKRRSVTHVEFGGEYEVERIGRNSDGTNHYTVRLLRDGEPVKTAARTSSERTSRPLTSRRPRR
jgi:hypothetical protein